MANPKPNGASRLDQAVATVVVAGRKYPKPDWFLPDHAMAQRFSMIQDNDTKALVRSIVDTGGLLYPITVRDGAVLDGRNRQLAFVAATHHPDWQGEDRPPYTQFDGDNAEAWRFVLAANVHRRQLSLSQRGMIAAGMVTARRGRPKKNCESTDLFFCLTYTVKQAAAAVGVGEPLVAVCRKVLAADCPAEVPEAVKSGLITANDAEAVLDESAEVLLAALALVRATKQKGIVTTLAQAVEQLKADGNGGEGAPPHEPVPPAEPRSDPSPQEPVPPAEPPQTPQEPVDAPPPEPSPEPEDPQTPELPPSETVDMVLVNPPFDKLQVPVLRTVDAEKLAASANRWHGQADTFAAIAEHYAENDQPDAASSFGVFRTTLETLEQDARAVLAGQPDKTPDKMLACAANLREAADAQTAEGNEAEADLLTAKAEQREQVARLMEGK